MPWWAWVVGIVGALAVLLVAALRSYRAGIRRALLDELGRAYPDLRVVEEGGSVVKLASPKMGEIELRLGGLFAECARAPDAAARDAIVRRFAASVQDNAAAGPVSL